MSQRKKFIVGLFGVIIGLCIGSLLRNYHTLEIVSMCNSMSSFKQKNPLEIISLHSHETPNNSQRNLVFVGVMTAKNYLQGRASAVYNTWGKNVPGRIAFFSSEDSYSDELPIVALKGVDDRYPPQKKSFMMLHYMYEHYIDKFEWFARADDDVFVRTDKLEKFLRSIDSSKVQFIGQAGRGNSEEFGLLSLEYDENFCMGGPGVILSQETLRRVAPHIPTCLKNLYSNHEDVEIGRCVQKFAGIPCTWNYEMQTIFHHNSSGNRAFTGNLKNKEVHSAITLHPIKKAPLMYRMHSYMLGLDTQDLRQESLYLHRDITQMLNLLGIDKSNKELALNIPIYPNSEYNKNYLGDPTTSGTNPDLNRYKPTNIENILEWDFIAKSIYSSVHANPKRKIESPMKEGLDDVIREIMENINNFSRQRGRVIEFRELLYGYSRTNAIFGQDLILDLLLVYKKYRGKKMTVPVRRHLYIQRSFTEIRIREMVTDSHPTVNTYGNSISSSKTNNHFLSRHQTIDDQPLKQKNVNGAATSLGSIKLNQLSDKMKYYLNSGLEKLTDTLSIPALDRQKSTTTGIGKIVFVLPLAGRYETLLRFLNNYEDVCLTTSTNTDLLLTLFQDAYNTTTATLNALAHLKRTYPKRQINHILMSGEFSRGLALDHASRSSYVGVDDILLFIDVDILFTATTLDRIRKNTIQKRQVYLPIVFSEYNPQRITSNADTGGGLSSSGQVMMGSGSTPSTRYRSFSAETDYQQAYGIYVKHLQQLQIDNESGYFRQFGYGIVAIYKSDILHPDIDGFVTDIKGWGLEDVKFLEKIISSNHKPNQKILNIADGTDDLRPDIGDGGHVTLNVFRSADTSLVHIYHPIICDKHLDDAQYKMCLGTLGNTLGNHRLLENYFLHNKFILDYAKSSKASNMISNNLINNNNNRDDERTL